MKDLFVKAKIQMEQHLPFVLFSKPGSERSVGLFQKNDHLYFLEDFDKKGFVFAPFELDTIPFIPLEFSDVYIDKKPYDSYYFEHDKNQLSSSYGKDFFENLVAKGVSAIHSGFFQKVVLSRKEELTIENFDWESSFSKMMFLYPNAFTYCFFHPKIGLWFGATPEQFLKVDKTILSTVALAGTRAVDAGLEQDWPNKEREEQQMVTDFIVTQLESYAKEITVSAPYSFNAGSIEHIKTDVTAVLKNSKSLASIITAMHPTSAVCGLPKLAAREFIIRNEGYDREYYSGFLGELNIDLQSFKTQKTDLYVNLRCMKVQSDKVTLYIGCGITGSSDPEKEYLETVNKSLTMKRVL